MKFRDFMQRMESHILEGEDLMRLRDLPPLPTRWEQYSNTESDKDIGKESSASSEPKKEPENQREEKESSVSSDAFLH